MRLTFIGLLVFGLACAPAIQEEQPVVTSLVHLVNYSWSDVNVSLLDEAGYRYTISRQTTSLSDHVFPLGTPPKSGLFRLLVHPIGGFDDYMSEPFLFEPGQTLVIHIESHLPNTSISVIR